VIDKITIEVIPHRDQRYNTVGDWQFVRDEEGQARELNIKVSQIGEVDANMLIAIHEFVEAILCELGGVKEKDIDQFDINWVPRKAWWNSDTMISEPGEDDRAPYYSQHQTAVGIERIVGTRLWTNWERYEAQADKLISDHFEFFIEKLKKQGQFAEKALSEVTVVSEVDGPGEEDGPWASGHEERSKPGPVVIKTDDFSDDIPF
jgi:hypothetical protein